MTHNSDALKQKRLDNDQAYGRELNSLFKQLRAQSIGNIEYFQGANGGYLEKFYSCFIKLYDHLDNGIEPGVEKLLSVAHLYDYDYTLPANGYRTMVNIVHKCCVHILQLMRHITINRSSFLFRSGHYSRELDAYVTTIGQLRAILYYLCHLIKYCTDGNLFPDENVLDPEDYKIAEQLMMEVELLSQETFYGRCLGFQYCESMKKPLKTIVVALASFADGYNHNSTILKIASSVLGGGRYIMNPELRAKQVVEVTRNSDIQFCKAFWSMNESQLPLFICPTVQIDKVIVLQPDIFELPLADGLGTTRIKPPCSHSGVAPVNTRLLSYQLRQGQEHWTAESNTSTTPTSPIFTPGSCMSSDSTSLTLPPPSPYLLLHCHGGGFVAQSSASHQVYLRHWAKALDIPIFCVDYSLAPENPFPRALEEVFFAYCWAIKNARLLGSTGEHICLCGDSAGGNLAIAVALRIAQYGIRTPSGILSTYGVTLVKYTPSPARITSLLDPLLPIGVVANVLAAYAGVVSNQGEQVSLTNQHLNKSQHKDMRHKSMGSNDSGFEDIMLMDTHTQPNDLPHNLPKPSTPTCDATGNEAARVGDTSSNLVHMEEEDNETHRHKSTDAHGDHHSMNTIMMKTKRETMTPDMDTEYFCKRHTLFHSPSTPSFSSVSCPTQRHSVGVTPCSSSPSSVRSCHNLMVPHYAQIRHFAQSPIMQFKDLPIATNPYMSPQLASDDQLKTLCPIYLVACHLDPMLDDSVMFAKRLKAVNKEVHLDVLPDLPHGFLNFTLMSKEAEAGSQVCIDRIKDILKLHNRNDIQSYEVIGKEEVDYVRSLSTDGSESPL